MAGNTQSTQYNQIVDGYSILYPPGGETSPDYPIAAIEAHQLYLAVSDPANDIRGKRVLDLASGGGYYASKLLSWGAASVTGVDISSEMIERARQDASNRGIPESKLRYLVGDATDESLTIDGGPFDMVTGCWLLNYAPDTPTMTKMWRNIGRNLKPGGVWVGLTLPPLASDQPWAQEMLDHAMSSNGPWGRHGDGGKILGPAPNGDGFKMRTDLWIPGRTDVFLSFENYYLNLSVFEQSCADSKLFAGVEWCDFAIPDEAKVGRPVGFWNGLSLYPHCRVFTAKRV